MPRFFYVFFLFFVGMPAVFSQDGGGPCAKFSFNNGKDYDEISHTKIKMVGVKHNRDRFDNEHSAAFFSGNSLSYVNLGTYAALKPKTGSISLWVNQDSETWSGKGLYLNPFIITKNANGDDFNEAYEICYYPARKKIIAICTRDSLREVAVASTDTFRLNKWYHLVVTYDNKYMCFYINGKLEQQLEKNFETKFLKTDSVVLGVTASKKNERFLTGTIDDVEFYNRVLSADEVYELYTAPNPNKNTIILNWVLLGFGAVLLVILILIFTRYRIKMALAKERERNELKNTALENELRVHRALMNPHFIFNSLNGLQNFILTNSTEEANDYLIKFSKLIRKILESNMADTITLELETELLERYLEIEDMRFEENIIHSITMSPDIVPSATVIPIMMLQPFVENAIWHGLLNKEGDKSIDISFTLYNKKYIRCSIEDNGIGRQQINNDDAEKKSLATLFIHQRLNLLNKIHNMDCSLTIEDKPGNTGTIVIIILPILK